MRKDYSCLNSNRDRRILENVAGYHDTNKISLKKSRLCLKCGKKFLSIGPHNRLCENCVSTNEKIALKTFYASPKHLNNLIH